jgi:hypothetical protein
MWLAVIIKKMIYHTSTIVPAKASFNVAGVHGSSGNEWSGLHFSGSATDAMAMAEITVGLAYPFERLVMEIEEYRPEPSALDNHSPFFRDIDGKLNGETLPGGGEFFGPQPGQGSMP